MTDLDIKGCQSSVFTLKLSPLYMLSGALIYRPPGSAAEILSSLPDIIASYVVSSSNFTLLGDFNLHLDNDSCQDAASLIQDLAALQLRQVSPLLLT